MATSTLLNITDQRNGTQWTGSWSDASSVTRIYCGPTGDTGSYSLYRNRITFNTNNVIISSSSKLVVECKVREQNYYCSALTARLSQTTINPNDYYESASWTGKYYIVSQGVKNATILASSAFKDSNGSTGVGSGTISNGTSIYFVFNFNNVIKQNQTYYIYLAQESSSGNYFTALDVMGITLTHETYTKCGAPSSVSLGGYIVPNGNFTVSWGAGTAGNANNITGYRIYCKSSSSVSSPSTSDKYFDAGKDDRSFTIPASQITNGDKRGWYITCAVQTLGSAGSAYYSDLKTHSGGVTINTLPKTNNMTVTASKTILPSTGGSVTFTPSGATDDHHSVSYAYATSATGTKNPISGNSVSLNISKDTTVYFWAYDGLEYSTGNKSQTIQINTKPTCSVLLESENVEDTDTIVPSGYKYILSPAFAASKDNDTLSNNNSFSYYYRIYNNPEANPTLENSYGSGERLSITDVRSVFPISPPYYYSFGVKVNDGIEDSDVIWTNKYYVTGAPAIKNIYNTNTGNNVTGMGSYDDKQNPLYFSKQLCFDFVYDTGYIEKSFTLKNSSKSAQVGALSDKSCLRAFFNDCGITASGEHTLSGYFLNKSDCSCQASRTMYRIYPFEIKELSVIGCKPHTNKNIQARIASNNLGGVITNPKQFGINAENVDSIKSFVGTLNYQNNTLTQALEINSKGDKFEFNFTYNHDSFGVNKDKTYTMAFTLSLTNAFGETYSGSQDITVDYKEDPIINSINIGLPNEGTNEIKKGQKITITISYENCYNSNQILSFITPYGTEEVKLTEIKENKTFSFEVPETQITREINKLDFIITNDANTSDSLEVETNIKFLKHTIPNVVLARTDYSESNSGDTPEGSVAEGDLTIYFSPSDWGLDPVLQKENTEITLTLYRPKTENADKVELGTKTFTNNVNLTSCLFENITVGEKVDWQAQDIYLEVIVASTTYKPTEYTQAATNTILVYNLTPTVAYRKNQLGVNIKDPTEHTDAAIVIGGAGNRDKIFYETNQDRPYCKVVNFQFNGGSWTSGLDSDDIGVIVGELTPAENLSF